MLELCFARVASEFKGKDFNDVKRKFGLDDCHFTPEEEEKIKKEHPWIITETEEKIKKLTKNPLEK